MSPRRAEWEPWDRPWRTGPRTRFERSARFWLNAYPLRWREKHGEEVLGVLEDVARRDDGTLPARLARSEAFALVRAGWSLRWRERPPLWRWAGYRILGRRLPDRYWWWVADDVRSGWYPTVDGLSRLAVVLIVQVGGFAALTWHNPFSASAAYSNGWFWVVLAVIAAVAMTVSRNGRRRHAWLRHVVEGNVPESMRPGTAPAGRMTPGVDPAITGELPEERPRS